MKFWILAVGGKMPPWIDSGFGEYARRMPREARIELVEIKPESRSGGKPLARILTAERQRICAALPHHCIRVVLDERGEGITTSRLAQRITGWMQEGRDVAFVIGGADGLDPEFGKEADWVMSLSRLTLPHGLARVVLAEQLYRALSLIGNHPYHRE